MFKPHATLYKFDAFQLDAVRRVLLRDEQAVQLPSRAFDVLLALLENSQSVLDKDELMRLVWGDRVVEENNLTRHISTLRRALDEGPNDHRYIVTVPGHGYSFVAPVEKVSTNGAPSVDENQNGNSRVASTEVSTATERRGFDNILRPGEHVGTEATSAIDTLASNRAKNLRRTWLWATVFPIVIAGALLGLKLISANHKPPAIKTYRDWDVLRLTRTGGSVTPDISRDGKYAAYINSSNGKQSVWIFQIATSASHQIVPPEEYAYFNLCFTPDGS